MWHLQKFRGQPGCGPLLFSIFFSISVFPHPLSVSLWFGSICSTVGDTEGVQGKRWMSMYLGAAGSSLLTTSLGPPYFPPSILCVFYSCFLFNLVFIIVVHRMVCQHKLFSDWRLKPVIEFQRQMECRLSIRVLTETIWVCIPACHAWLWGPGHSFLILIISAAKLRGGHL